MGQYMLINKFIRTAVRADNAHEQNNQDIRKGDSPVILSEAKDQRSEASRCPWRQTLRGVYPERSEWAQGDSRGADFYFTSVFVKYGDVNSVRSPAFLPGTGKRRAESGLFKRSANVATSSNR